LRKYVIGFVAGVLLSSVAPAYGAVSSLIGKEVQGEYAVKVDGTTLAKKSIAIDGTTYAPLREIGEAIGYDVDFLNKEVVFTKNKAEVGGSEPVTTSDPVETNEPTTSEYTIEEIDSQIISIKQGLEIWGKIVDGYDKSGRTDGEAELARNTVKQLTEQLEIWKQRKAELERK